MPKIKIFIAGLFGALLLALFFAATGCSKRDPVINVDDHDPEMLAAIAKARASLPQFWEAFDKREHGEKDFALKVPITEKKEGEFFWLSKIERKDGKTFGTIDNDPDIVHNVKLGDRIAIPEADISDWMFMRDGKMVGNYTIRVLFKQMPAGEVAKYKAIMAEP
jgi:uncharacterized protein YegJ (DUF2314 family)